VWPGLLADLLQPDRQAPHSTFAHIQFAGGLPQRDQFLLFLFQHHQPISTPLGHGENSGFSHLSSLTLSIGHFYLAQSENSHVAPTPIALRFTPFPDSAILNTLNS
jgi:hypothetical protein